MKKMNRLIWSTAYCFALSCLISIYAQPPHKKAPDKSDEKARKEIKKTDKVMPEDQQNVQKPQGKSECKPEDEHGPLSADQARMKQEQKGEELDNSVNQGEEKVKEARTKIADARAKLEKDKKARKISDAEYKQRKEKIDKAEAATDELEKKVEEGETYNQEPME